MIHPEPTTPIAPTLARATLLEVGPMTAGKPEFVVLGFANTNYRMRLTPTAPITTRVGKPITGTIHAKARRIDVVGTGGRFVEPVFGEPGRIQGRVVAIQGAEVVVHAGMPIAATPTDPRQQAGDFRVGQFVSFDIDPGASFSPEH